MYTSTSKLIHEVQREWLMPNTNILWHKLIVFQYQIWNECGSSCTPTCDVPLMPCNRMCNQRCECPTERPLWHEGECITLAECPSPCSIGTHLRDVRNKAVFCGRGPERMDCPETHLCNIHPGDRGAVCCDQLTGSNCHTQLQSVIFY